MPKHLRSQALVLYSLTLAVDVLFSLLGIPGIVGMLCTVLFSFWLSKREVLVSTLLVLATESMTVIRMFYGFYLIGGFAATLYFACFFVFAIPLSVVLVLVLKWILGRFTSIRKRIGEVHT